MNMHIFTFLSSIMMVLKMDCYSINIVVVVVAVADSKTLHWAYSLQHQIPMLAAVEAVLDHGQLELRHRLPQKRRHLVGAGS
jgi:hypothetical protein